MTILTVISMITLCELFHTRQFNHYNGIFWGHRSQIFAVWVQTPLSNDEKEILILSGNISSLRAVNCQNIYLACKAATELSYLHMNVGLTLIDLLSTIHKSCSVKCFPPCSTWKIWNSGGTGIENGSECSNGMVHFSQTIPTKKSGLPWNHKWTSFFHNFCGRAELIYSV